MNASVTGCRAHSHQHDCYHLGAIQVLRNAMGGGGVSFPRKKCYEGVRFNGISVIRGWVGVKFPGKNRYVTLEWALLRIILLKNISASWQCCQDG